MADKDDKKPAGDAPESTPEAAAEATSGGPEAPAAEPTPEQVAAAKEKAAAEAAAKREAAAKAKAAAEAAKPPWLRDPETPEWVEAGSDPLVVALQRDHGAAIIRARAFAGDLVIEATAAGIRDLCRALRDEHGYRLLVDALGVHFPDRESGCFEVVYIVYNLDTEQRLRVKVATDEGVELPSLCPVWVGVNWPEREVYDMYGVRFTDHPDMTRILLWEGFNGHPLRKDFPVEGIDTGSAIYPEYYDQSAGPVAGTGTGWKPTPPPAPETPPGSAPEPAEESPES